MTQRDYRDWQEGLGDSAKPEDYDQQPGKYEVQVWDSDVKAWEGYTPKQIPMWWGGLTYRVRRRQPQVPLCSTDVSWAQPRLETDAEFALRLWRTYAQFVVVDKMECVCVMPHERLVMPPADALRLARIIAEAKPCHD